MLDEFNIVKAKALDDYKIYLMFQDGIEGIVDLSDLKGKGIFKLWDDYNEFKKVAIDPITQTVCWNEQIDLDAINLKRDLMPLNN